MSELVRLNRERQAGFMWPEVVHSKLDQLVQAVESSGDSTTRKEITAAIIAFTALDGEALVELVQRFRTARVDDILPPESVRPLRRR